MSDTIRVCIRDDNGNVAFRDAAPYDDPHNVYDIPRDLYSRMMTAREEYDKTCEQLHEQHTRPRWAAIRQQYLKTSAERYTRQYAEHVELHGVLTEEPK